MTSKLNIQQALKAGAIAAGAAAVINAIVFFIGQAAGIITDNVFVEPNQPLTIAPVLISSIVPAIIGSFVFFLFEKYTQNGYKNFSILAIAFLVFSLAGPFNIPNVPVAYAIALNVMHLVVGGAVLYFIGQAIKKA